MLTNPMTKLNEFRFIPLDWHQPDIWKRYYQLKFDDELVATLKWRNIFGTKVEGWTSVGKWIISRKGLFHPVYHVKKKGSKQTILKVRVRSSKIQPIKAPSGNVYQWKRFDFWKREYGWMLDDKPIMEFKALLGIKRRHVNFFYILEGVSEEELSILLLLGTFFAFRIKDSGSA